MSPSFRILLSCIALAISACSDNSRQAENRQTPAANGLPSGSTARAEQLTRVIDCAAAFESATALYTILSRLKGGAERDSLLEAAEVRRDAAEQVHMRAIDIAHQLGMTQADLQARVRQARQRNRDASRRGDFSDFAVRMNREAARCAADLPRLL